MSSTSQHPSRHDNEGPIAGAEHATENDKLSRNVLGLIDAYRMGAALDARGLFVTRTSAPAPESAAATS